MRFITTIAVAAALVVAAPAIADKGGNGNGNGGNGPSTGVITVSDAVYAGMTTATVNPGGADTYVFVQCYAPDFNGAYVYAGVLPGGFDQPSSDRALWSTLWPQGDASCQAQEGYFTRNGFGRWVDLATTTFHVDG